MQYIFHYDNNLRKGSSTELPFRVSKNPQTGKNICRFGVFFYYLEVSVTGLFVKTQVLKKACTASVFAFLHNLPATVSIYADAGKLLVFGAPLTSGSLSQKEFFDRLNRTSSEVRFLFVLFQILIYSKVLTAKYPSTNAPRMIR